MFEDGFGIRRSKELRERKQAIREGIAVKGESGQEHEKV